MKLPRVFSCAVLALLLLTSSSVAAGTSQRQAQREQELSAALAAGNGVIVIGGADDFAFTLRARSRINRPFAIEDGINDPLIMSGFQNQNPARDGFMNNPARGGFMLSTPIRR
ncbi:hypothetical protein [Citrobacter sp. FDAARGOS_156]|uniref:hypothetical protein n=1 Tax=Citrobacter sp. FDAARGOS_156 TaxID=1702170 RepID=UPI0019011784|nr:hypothetical protein [Citrobacter sp. FDAARGOS_156]MBJ8883131.1 hypothetical protein [Citrobacter sp. FDAARGOS_156]HED2479695.1 hypothetical protein [Citrobacter youngae]